MTEVERFPLHDPRAWLHRARSSLRYAEARPEGVCFEDMSYQA